MTHLRPTAMLLALLTTPALTAPAFAADGELTVFDWSGFEDPRIFQKYVDQHGAEPTFAFYGDDDEAYQKLASGFKADVAHPCSQMVSKYRDAGRLGGIRGAGDLPGLCRQIRRQPHLRLLRR